MQLTVSTRLMYFVAIAGLFAMIVPIVGTGIAVVGPVWVSPGAWSPSSYDLVEGVQKLTILGGLLGVAVTWLCQSGHQMLPGTQRRS